MKPLFIILLLIAFTASLTSRISNRGFFAHFDLEGNILILPTPTPPVFNSTLLKMAAVDTGEAGLKQEIEDILKTDREFTDGGGYWTSDSPRRRFSQQEVRVTSSKVIPEFKRVLRNWAEKQRYGGNIMTELVKLVKHRIDEHNGSVGSDSKYNSCAVVGNSGILLKKEYGRLIDSHEVVIRINNAKTENFERNVGSKTSISFVNSHILNECSTKERRGCYCQPYAENVPTVMYICQPLHLLAYTQCNWTRNAPTIVTDGRFDVLSSRIVKYYSLKRFVEEEGKRAEEWAAAHDNEFFHYSSGMQAVLLALGVCEKASLFGFGKWVSAKHHYHSEQRTEIRSHDYEAEYAFYGDLVNNTWGVPFITGEFKFPPVVIYQ
ncbi:putative sialyltransferase [Tripterygium wilfordii]|uniref:Putative sialyltransferase n=1 Tax=Tripterygium wilfordii TaxID=458696 RepID=A0A7J7C0R3_TRIWF|nr:beta-1,6-galactosyltransferase GALT29A-like [Tripterygium wilfordii]KAF5727525.1 putative sialyltransferase [Tripterygium wilfordii]